MHVSKFKTASGEKTVKVRNVRVELLHELGTRFNALLPRELHIREVVIEREIPDDEELEDLFPSKGGEEERVD